MKRGLLLAVSVLALSGCGGGSATADPAPPETSTAIAWAGVAELRPADGELDVEPFRRFAEGVDAAWERDPEAVVREYLGVDDGAFSVDGTRATVLREGLEDDSVAAERWVLELERDGNTWSLVAARWEQRCHDGRGHTTFGNELCL